MEWNKQKKLVSSLECHLILALSKILVKKKFQDMLKSNFASCRFGIKVHENKI